MSDISQLSSRVGGGREGEWGYTEKRKTTREITYGGRTGQCSVRGGGAVRVRTK